MSKLSEGEPYRPGNDTGVAVVVEYSRPAKRGVHDENSTSCPAPSSLAFRMRHS